MKKVIIDCGHGGIIDGKYVTAPNKMYEFTQEHIHVYEGEINRSIGRKLEVLLQKNGHKFFSLNTHDQSDMSLSERVKRINNAYAADKSSYWLLSIHSNTASMEHKGTGSNATGFELWTSIGQTVSDKIADVAAEVYKKSFPDIKFRQDMATDNDVDKEANFTLLKNTYCPAILVENLFYDNLEEAKKLLNEDFQTRIAECLFNIVNKVAHSNIW